jgi:hypothetical protein
MPARFASLSSLVLALSLVAALPGAEVGQKPTKVPVDEIIQKFVEKETEFARARELYTYRQSVKLTEFSEGNRPTGRWELFQDIIFGPNRDRTERVVFAPVATLQRISLSPQDMQDLRDVQPFVMTMDNWQDYDITYMGEEKIDEIETYVFSIKPKQLEKGKRYFQGQAWVDQRDLQIVKTYGKGVGVLKKNEDQAFPAFETYREQIDGQYWFPTYTRAEDVLQFKSGQRVPIKLIIKYDDYKRFGGEATITFGDIVDDTETPDEDPQIEQPQP